MITIDFTRFFSLYYYSYAQLKTLTFDFQPVTIKINSNRHNSEATAIQAHQQDARLPLSKEADVWGGQRRGSTWKIRMEEDQ